MTAPIGYPPLNRYRYDAPLMIGIVSSSDRKTGDRRIAAGPRV